MEKFYIILRTVTGHRGRHKSLWWDGGERGADDLRVRENHTRKLVPPKSTLAKPSMALSIISRVEFTMRHRFIWGELANGSQARYFEARTKVWRGETGTLFPPFHTHLPRR